MPTMDEATTRRTALVWHLVHEGSLHDVSVRDAMLAIPRHLFLPTEPLARAYLDDAIPTKRSPAGIAISSASQPTMVALMLEQLALASGMRVLEIGAGTGYNAALLRNLVGETGHVTTIDIDADITAAAHAHLAAAGITDVTVITGDGAGGYAPNAPYDRIILTVSAGDIAPAWIEQLTPDGLLVLPLRIGTNQFSIAFAREEETLHSRSIIGCGFMPLRGVMDDSGVTQQLAPGLSATIPPAFPLDIARLAALLVTPPAERTIAGIERGAFSMLSLSGYNPIILQSEDTRYGFEGGAFALMNAAQTGVCVVRYQMGKAYNPALVYGDMAAADDLTQAIAAWEAGDAGLTTGFSITADPRNPALPLPPAPDGAHIVTLPHWYLTIARS